MMGQTLLIFCAFIVLAAGIPKDGTCPDMATLQKMLRKAELMDALEELKFIRDKLGDHHYKNPCENRRCLDLHDFEDSGEPPKEFDFVIVGGGRSGSVTANRLSEVPTLTVAVLDMGDDISSLSTIPAFSSYTKFTKYTKTKCINQQDDFALAMSHLPVFEGKAFGGSSTMNTNILNAGNPADFDNSTFGCYNEQLAYFQKSERAKYTGPVNSAYHNFDGPLPTSQCSVSEVGQAFINCGTEKGFREIDPFGEFTEGFYKVKSNAENGRRVSHYEAFIEKITYRKNLELFGETYVYKILFDGKKAIGVKYVKGKKIYTMLARKEVIIASGAIDAAKLLIISGIGPKDQLKKFKIRIVNNLPVGQTLFDKVAYIGLAFETKSSSTPRSLQDILNKETLKKYLESNDGPLTNPFNVETIGIKAINSHTPNVEYRLRNAFWTTDKGTVDIKTIGMCTKFYKKWLRQLEGRRVFSIQILLKAFSSGKVKIRSHDVFEDPAIHGNYFSNPHDVRNMIHAIKFILHLMKCESFQKLGIKFYDVPVPGCEHIRHDEYKYWECAVRHLTVPYQDFHGTCRMGLPNDPMAVVDPLGMVYGVENLRIIGRSILPTPTFGGAGALTTMLAERAGDKAKQVQGIFVKDYCSVKKF